MTDTELMQLSTSNIAVSDNRVSDQASEALPLSNCQVHKTLNSSKVLDFFEVLRFWGFEVYKGVFFDGISSFLARRVPQTRCTFAIKESARWTYIFEIQQKLYAELFILTRRLSEISKPRCHSSPEASHIELTEVGESKTVIWTNISELQATRTDGHHHTAIKIFTRKNSLLCLYNCFCFIAVRIEGF